MTEAEWLACAEPMPMLEFLRDKIRDRAWRHKEQIVLAREIFGNPFRPVIIAPAWLTFTVVQLSQAIYAERAFDTMPILADALEDAGCNNEDMLNHCRSGREHCRGCWVVDLLTGRE